MVQSKSKNKSKLQVPSSPKKQVKDDGDRNEVDLLISPLRVMMLGMLLLAIGASGFYLLPGMISDDASGSRIVNSFYCSTMTLTTIGFGDICPDAKLAPESKLFIVILVVAGLGFFCGPMLEVTSSWTTFVPGGLGSVASITIAVGVSLFSNLEDIPNSDAIYASLIVGTTIGYGDFTPKTDMGKVAVAVYAIAAINVVAALLKPGKVYLEDLCRIPVERKKSKPKAS